MRGKTLALLVTLAGAIASAAPANAAVVTYTFEAPNFVLGERTPLMDRAPNIGGSGFLASFSASPSNGGFLIGDFVPNPLMSGRILYDDNPPVDTLTVTFGQPVIEAVVDFALLSPGEITLAYAGGSDTRQSSDVGGPFQGGTIGFTAAFPFTWIRLSAVDFAGAPNSFAIDNLRLTTVPEPNVLALFGLGLAGLGAMRRKKLAA